MFSTIFFDPQIVNLVKFVTIILINISVNMRGITDFPSLGLRFIFTIKLEKRKSVVNKRIKTMRCNFSRIVNIFPNLIYAS